MKRNHLESHPLLCFKIPKHTLGSLLTRQLWVHSLCITHNRKLSNHAGPQRLTTWVAYHPNHYLK